MRHIEFTEHIKSASNEPKALDTEFPKETSRKGAHCHAPCCFTRACTFKGFPTISGQPLETSRKIRVTRSWPMNCRCSLQVIQSAVLVWNQDGDWSTSGSIESHPSENFRMVMFDSHAASPAIAALTSFQLIVDKRPIHLNACRNALKDRQDPWSMRFTGRPVCQCRHGSAWYGHNRRSGMVSIPNPEYPP